MCENDFVLKGVKLNTTTTKRKERLESMNSLPTALGCLTGQILRLSDTV